MRFSLILSTIQRTSEVEGCLAALDAQTYREFELIVVDQNVDDRLVPILAPYKDRFDTLHLKSARKGLARAKNLGLKHVSNEIIGFLDDDCRYPPELLDSAMRFLTEHREVAGLCGRSVSETGEDSNGRYDREPGMIDMFNVWRRSVTYSMFLRTESVQGTWFDENLGPGSGTAWWAADETDYLLQLLRKGVLLYYNPDLTVFHPDPLSLYDEAVMRRAYHYGCAMGHVLVKHRYPLWFRSKMVVHPLKRAVLSLANRKIPEAKYRWHTFRGRLAGLFS